jgi:hypothetical protein
VQDSSFGRIELIVVLKFICKGGAVKSEAQKNKTEGQTSKYITEKDITEHKNLKKEKNKNN